MSDLDIVRLSVIRLCNLIKDLAYCTPQGELDLVVKGSIRDNLMFIYDAADQIAKELERP